QQQQISQQNALLQHATLPQQYAILSQQHAALSQHITLSQQHATLPQQHAIPPQQHAALPQQYDSQLYNLPLTLPQHNWKHGEIKILLDHLQEKFSTWSKGNKSKFYNDITKNILSNKEANAIK
ncbi:18571_t:CDS:2, partial [Funneliformis geosporum]